jgi:hypothetical protein
MRPLFLCLFGLAIIAISCNRIDTSASLHQVVSKPTRAIEIQTPFPADSLLSFTYAGLVRAFGKEQLVTSETGTLLKSAVTVVLFPTTEKEIIIVLEDSTDQAKVSSVVLRTPSRWTTVSGLTPGISLKDVEELNGNAFLFYGGGWDQGGIITNWNKGVLDSKILKLCRLDRKHMMPYDLSKGDYDTHEFSSSSKDAQRGNPSVEEIVLAHH